MDNTTRLLTILIVLLAFAVTALAIPYARRRPKALALRPVAGFEAVPLVAGASVEQGRPLMIALKGEGIGGNPTPFALASAEITYQVVRRVAMGARTPIVAVSETSMIPVAHSALQRAYASRGRLSNLRPEQGTQWYAAGPRSIAFAALLVGLSGSTRASGMVLAGSFGAEIALPLWGAANTRIPSIAAPREIEGQAVAYVMADHALLGDEFALAGAQLGGDAASLGAVVAQNFLRYLVIAALLLPAVVVIGDAITSGSVSRLLTSLLGGGG